MTIPEETLKLITLFRLEGLTREWAVYWAAPDRGGLEGSYRNLESCRSDHNKVWDYYRVERCHILSEEHMKIIKELDR